MNRKKKIAIVLGLIFVLIAVGGGIYIYFFQLKDINKKDAELEKLQADFSSIETLNQQLAELEKQATTVDSVLFTGKFTIPQNLSQSDFYEFVDKYSRDGYTYTYTNTDFLSEGIENGFNYYLYKVAGNGVFDSVYGLIYAIEHSRDFKKINSAELKSTTFIDDRKIPRYLVNFEMEVKVYFSSSDMYATKETKEYDLSAVNLYDAFFPLVRDEIRPNTQNLPDIQDATLISLIAQGAFISDSKGNTLLLKKGDRVYLGYLSDIDYENEQVTFILNKGGILEYKVLKLER